MKILFTTLLLIFATLAGVYCKQFNLPIIMVYQHWSIEMPMWLILCLSFVALSGLLMVYHLLASTYTTLSMHKHKRIYSQQLRGFNQLQTAVIQLLEGNYATAEKAALGANKLLGNNFLSYLTAAQAANAQEAWQMRDSYLQQAIETEPESAFAITLQKVNLQVSAKQYDACLATFNTMETTANKYKINPNHPKLLALRYKIYLATKKFDKLYAVLQRIKPTTSSLFGSVFNKTKTAINSQELQQFQEAQLLAYKELLINAANKYDYAYLNNIWQNIPKASKKNEITLLLTYIKCLLKLNANSNAEKILRNHVTYLQKNNLLQSTTQHEQLFELYGLTNGENLPAQIAFLESLLPTVNNTPSLLHAIARLCIKQQLWGKARNYLQASVNTQPSSAGYIELAKLLEQLGEVALSNNCYKDGLLALQGNRSSLALTDTSLANTNLTATEFT